MKQYTQEPGNRIVKGNDLLAVQDIALLVELFLKECSGVDFIISGCVASGNSISSGVVMLSGKACIFGGATSATFPYYVKSELEVEYVTYETGTGVGPGYNIYKAVATTSSDTGAFRLDNAPRFADVFKPKKAVHADVATSANEADYALEAASAINANYALAAGNADTVGGLHASDIRKVFTNLGNVDFNSVKIPGDYFVQSNLNAPVPSQSAGWYVNVERTTVSPDTYVIQLATYYGDKDNGLYWRKCYDGTNWTAWKRVNDGGNADMVDGKHASEFSTMVNVSDWDVVNYKAGDVLRGTQAAATSPSSSYCTAIALTVDNNPAYVKLLGFDTHGRLYTRQRSNGVWQPWQGILSTTGVFDSSVTASAFYDSSDERLKSNIKDVDVALAEKITFKQYVKDGKKEVGVIAQQVQ